MAYEVVMPYHLHMPSYFLGTFTEYPWYKNIKKQMVRLYGMHHLLVLNASSV